MDLRAETTVEGDIADLAAGPQVSTAVRQGFMRRPLVHTFALEALRLLSQQLATVDNREPLKLPPGDLPVSDRIRFVFDQLASCF